MAEIYKWTNEEGDKWSKSHNFAGELIGKGVMFTDKIKKPESDMVKMSHIMGITNKGGKRNEQEIRKRM